MLVLKQVRRFAAQTSTRHNRLKTQTNRKAKRQRCKVSRAGLPRSPLHRCRYLLCFSVGCNLLPTDFYSSLSLSSAVAEETNLSKSLSNNLSCITRYFSNSLSAKLFATSADTLPLSRKISSSLNYKNTSRRLAQSSIVIGICRLACLSA